MALIGQVQIARRFARSIRIDTDLEDPRALEGFVCPPSYLEVLLGIARHVSETGQGAFTWTGPFGIGKSSLIVAMSALLSGDVVRRQRAAEILGADASNIFWRTLPPGIDGWRVVPVVGRRDEPVVVIGEALVRSGIVAKTPKGGWNETLVLKSIAKVSDQVQHKTGGIILFLDEMGKLLEAAANSGSDLYILQQLAEASSRSNGHFLIVGVLHQAFDQYANRLSRETRDEWAKVQGRFVDLVVNTAGEEQIEIISRAIESQHRSVLTSAEAMTIAELIHPSREAAAVRLANVLERCWPLHPVVATLLGPISRRRFGQSQRSIFGFLSSAEPRGFQDFLSMADDDDVYQPYQLWDYLRINLEPSILASPDGHRWALAVEAIERCDVQSDNPLHVRLMKTIALVDIFKEHSGLLPSPALLKACFSDKTESDLKHALNQLNRWSLAIYKKFLGAYAVYAGSDFDIDGAITGALKEAIEVNFVELEALAGLQPMLAKRHFHETGSLRWFKVGIVPVSEIVNHAAGYTPDQATIGQFLLAIPSRNETEAEATRLCQHAAALKNNGGITIGLSKRSWSIATLARELIAAENVRDRRPELAGDSVARREVDARIAELQDQLDLELKRAFNGATWFHQRGSSATYRFSELNGLASEIADLRFAQCPVIHNELLNRHRPSSSAIAAQNALLRRMVQHEGTARLGIDGFPAEGGLLVSILEATGLYAEGPSGWHFAPPADGHSSRLDPIWRGATNHLKENMNRVVPVAEIYDLWRQAPYGVKEGLLPVLATSFILSQRNYTAIYREGVFRPRFNDVDVEYLAKDPSSVSIRWMDLSDTARSLLSGLSDVVRELEPSRRLINLEPIDVARGLIGIFEGLPNWTKRTARLSSNAMRVRELFKRARDPNQFLFDDIPIVVTQLPSANNTADVAVVVADLQEGLEELVRAYPLMISRMVATMLDELGVPNGSEQSLIELQARAKNIIQLSGDFRFESFVSRVARFDGSGTSFEGIASMAANKPARDWVDPDLDRAMLELVEMAQRFIRSETFARVKNRVANRHAIAVVFGFDGRQEPLVEEFEITDADREVIRVLVEKIEASMSEFAAEKRNITLGAITELGARYIKRSSVGYILEGENDARN